LNNEQADSYWDLLADVARVQGQLGEDMVAWAKMYEAGGRALQRSGHTLQEMAELGRRMQSYMESGPPAVVSQVLRMFTSPLAGGPMPGVGMGMGMPPGTSATAPFAQFWEAFASSLGPASPPPPEAGKSDRA
jgi:hypothetical protein